MDEAIITAVSEVLSSELVAVEGETLPFEEVVDLIWTWVGPVSEECIHAALYSLKFRMGDSLVLDCRLGGEV